jgi:hypothetical protein
VKELSLEEAPLEEDPWANGETDPTIANAGLNELDTAQTLPITTNGTGHTSELNTPSAPAATSIQEGAGNAAAEEQWDTKIPGEAGMEESFEMIPRDPTETEAPHVPAEPTSTQSWADDAPTPGETSYEPAVAAPAPAPENDGFSEVHHGNRGGRGRGNAEHRGGYRGRGGPRGDGFRGGRGRAEGRGGRGRGEGRGGRGGPRGGAPRGAPRGESSS